VQTGGNVTRCETFVASSDQQAKDIQSGLLRKSRQDFDRLTHFHIYNSIELCPAVKYRFASCHRIHVGQYQVACLPQYVVLQASSAVATYRGFPCT
jgi:hypothetical protein